MNSKRFEMHVDSTFKLANWFFKGFFVFWIISALLGIGLTVGLIVLIVQGVHYLNTH